MKVEPSGIKVDERLQYLLDEVKKAVGIFSEGVRSSTEEQVGISFKAFTLKSKSEAEVKAIFDVIMSAVAIELSTQAKDLIAIYTFYHSVEKGEEESSLMLHCRKVAPPTKEEIEAKLKEEEEARLKAIAEEAEKEAEAEAEVKGEMKLAIVDEVKEEEEEKKEEVKEEEKKEENVTLPHPSMMSAYGRPGCD